MRERPILFSGPMVRAILAGRKSQTRRLVKSPPGAYYVGEFVNLGADSWGWLDSDLSGEWRCPYGAPGDRLWVREAWRLGRINGASVPSAEFATVQFREDFSVLDYRRDWREHYAALLATERQWEESQTGNLWGRWRPSIHMPRWASRLTLEVTGVRVERLQEITDTDAQAEGATYKWRDEGWSMDWSRAGHPSRWAGDKAALAECDIALGTPRLAFANAWDRINGKRAPWASNPWVWVVDFKPAPCAEVPAGVAVADGDCEDQP